MFKKILAVSAMLFAISCLVAVEVNKGSAAEFDGLKGVGPSMSKRILDARQQSEFKDWNDLMSRVKGVKETTAAKLSAEGLTVNGKSFDGAAMAERKKPDAKVAPMVKGTAVKPAVQSKQDKTASLGSRPPSGGFFVAAQPSATVLYGPAQGCAPGPVGETPRRWPDICT